MQERFFGIYIGLAGVLAASLELYGIGYLISWLLPFDSWWSWLLVGFSSLMIAGGLFFWIWMASIVFWGTKDLLGRDNSKS